MTEPIAPSAATTIRICLVEDNVEMREGFAALLNQAPGLQCAGAYASAENALRELPAQKPDVVLVDINLPGMSGIECVARLKAQMPALQVLMLTHYEQSDLIFNSICAGASGYLLKNTPPEQLLRAIEQVHTGGAPMTMQIARKVIDHFRKIQRPASEIEKLTSRENEVLALLAKGYLYKEIGTALDISMNTVRHHLRGIYEKLHVHSRTEAAMKYVERK